MLKIVKNKFEFKNEENQLISGETYFIQIEKIPGLKFKLNLSKNEKIMIESILKNIEEVK